MTQPTKTPSNSTPAKNAKTVEATRRDDRRRELLSDACAARGVRFLPAQVMRSIYEREGVL